MSKGSNKFHIKHIIDDDSISDFSVDTDFDSYVATEEEEYYCSDCMLCCLVDKCPATYVRSMLESRIEDEMTTLEELGF